MRALMLLLLCALLPNVANARWYQVDVVAFRHNGDAANGGEEYAAEIELPDYSRAMALITEEPAAPAGGAPVPAQAVGAAPTTLPPPVPFTLLDRGERTLAEVERRLRNSREYAPVMSASWRQPNLGVAGAKTVYLTDLNTVMKPAPKPGAPMPAPAPPPDPSVEPPKPVVAGTVTVKVARLMNVDVDFIYDNDGMPVRLRETRKVKLREVHYFDHPLFGVIVQVTPWLPPNEDPARAAATADEPEDDAEEAPQPPPMPTQPVKPVPAKKTPEAPVKPKPAGPKMRMKPSTE